MTASSLPDRLLPPLLRPVVLDDVPDGWEQQAFDPSGDGDALSWLGFHPGARVEPLLLWPRPANWPRIRPRSAGRHRAPARARTA